MKQVNTIFKGTFPRPDNTNTVMARPLVPSLTTDKWFSAFHVIKTNPALFEYILPYSYDEWKFVLVRKEDPDTLKNQFIAQVYYKGEIVDSFDLLLFRIITHKDANPDLHDDTESVVESTVKPVVESAIEPVAESSSSLIQRVIQEQLEDPEMDPANADFYRQMMMHCSSKPPVVEPVVEPVVVPFNLLAPPIDGRKAMLILKYLYAAQQVGVDRVTAYLKVKFPIHQGINKLSHQLFDVLHAAYQGPNDEYNSAVAHRINKALTDSGDVYLFTTIVRTLDEWL